MMEVCEKHGLQLSVELSPDMAEAIEQGKEIPPYRILQYAYLGDVCHEFFLSEEFCNKHDIVETGEIELPRQYPEWIHELAAMCEICFQEVIKV